MANAFFPKGRQAFATAQVNWPADTIIVDLVDMNDVPTFSLSTFQFRSEIPAGARIATGTLTGLDALDGVLSADDVTLPTVTGDQAEALIVSKNTGSDATSPLLVFVDQATGLPVTPNGGDISIDWDDAGIGTL
ncbi:hypothetical protein [Pseudonocardia zijingensis]|uniref:Uncharacterized protein n=1 Tax=Pseudonocardia zijingensis TaxID=153376 RepID=A0ABN1N8N1_9PSEU